MKITIVILIIFSYFTQATASSYCFNSSDLCCEITVTHESSDYSINEKFIIFVPDYSNNYLILENEKRLSVNIDKHKIIYTQWNISHASDSFMHKCVPKLGYLLNMMIREKFPNKQNKLILIGHGVGSHIIGFCGKSLKNISEIIAINPSRKYFSMRNKTTRLDSSDADFVQVIQGFSLKNLHPFMYYNRILGHVNIYLDDLNNQNHEQIYQRNKAVDIFFDAAYKKNIFVAFKTNLKDIFIEKPKNLRSYDFIWDPFYTNTSIQGIYFVEIHPTTENVENCFPTSFYVVLLLLALILFFLIFSLRVEIIYLIS